MRLITACLTATAILTPVCSYGQDEASRNQDRGYAINSVQLTPESPGSDTYTAQILVSPKASSTQNLQQFIVVKGVKLQDFSSDIIPKVKARVDAAIKENEAAIRSLEEDQKRLNSYQHQ